MYIYSCTVNRMQDKIITSINTYKVITFRSFETTVTYQNNGNISKLHALRQLKHVTFSESMLRFSSQHSVFSILKKFQRDYTLYSILLFPISRSTCFGRNPGPSSGARLNCIHSIWGWQTVWIQFNRAPDDGRGLLPKHVERLKGKNKILYKV
jgi:hypothetical protein